MAMGSVFYIRTLFTAFANKQSKIMGYMTRHLMKLRSQPFNAIVSGRKIYELRLYDEKRKAIRLGDEILFTEQETGKTCLVKVTELLRFDSFDELYAQLPLTEIGYDEMSKTKASPNDMSKYYSKEEQSEYGVIAIKISLAD